MEKYEKTIGLKTVWLTFVRRWKIMLTIFIPSALVTLVISLFFVPKQYQSSAIYLNNATSSANTYSGIQYQIQKQETLEKTIKSLEENYSLTITIDTIANGLSFTAYNSSSPGIVKFSFTSKTLSIVKPVVETLSTVALDELKTNGFDKVVISSSASNPVSVGKGKTYLLIGITASAILGLGIAFIDEIISDEIYDEDDVLLLGSSSYGLITSKK